MKDVAEHPVHVDRSGNPNEASVTPLGTCRIYHPLRLHAARDGRFRFDEAGAYGYVHSTGEIVQQARHLSGELAIPADIWRLASERPHRFPDQDAHLDASVYVVEVSSLKDIRYGDWRLKGSRLDKALGDRELSRTFWRHSAADARGARFERLCGMAGYHALDAFLQDVVRESFVVRQDVADVCRDLDMLRGILPRFLVATHCDAIGHDGEPIADRRRGIATVRAAAQGLGLTVFEPAAVLAHWRQEDALPIFGIDTSHYTIPFARDVGAALFALIVGETSTPRASRVTRSDPDGRDAPIGRSVTRDDHVEAMLHAWCERGVPLDPAALRDRGGGDVYRLIAAALLGEEEGDGGVSALRRALRGAPDLVAVVADLARCAMMADRLRPAIRLFVAILDFPAHRPIAGRDLMALHRIALRRLNAAHDDAAIVENAALVLGLHPDQTSALRAAALALERLDRVAEAIVYWDRLSGNEPEIDRWRVSAQRARRRLERAQRKLSRSRR